MYKLTRFIPLFVAFAWMLTIGLPAANAASSSSNSKTKTTATTPKAKPSPNRAAEKANTKHAARPTRHVLASAEDLSGTITMVDPNDQEVTLLGSNGIPYDFKLTGKTLVELSNNKIGINQLASESNQPATIHFVPRSDGNLAKSIQIASS
jgi:hypothetical protein